MEIMQQKQIKAYLVREFIDDKGTKLFINEKNTEYAYRKHSQNRKSNECAYHKNTSLCCFVQNITKS